MLQLLIANSQLSKVCLYQINIFTKYVGATSHLGATKSARWYKSNESNEVKKELDKKLQKYQKVNIISIETQVVSGVNYRIKVNVDDRIGSIVIWHKLDRTVGYAKIQWEKEEL